MMIEISSIFNDFFYYHFELNIRQHEDPSVNLENISDLQEKIREKYKNHPSI